jgi:hypothetical protein
MKKVLLNLMLLTFTSFVFSQTPVFNNTINISQTFTSSTEIFPFNNQQINGAAINGSVTLNSDTSLIRIILKDSLTFEYMIFESYPMLDTIWSFVFNEECEETCFLDGFTPTSIIIFLCDATVYLDNFVWCSTQVNNPISLQMSSKQNKVSEKLNRIKSYIAKDHLIWNADFTYYSDLFYFEKIMTGAVCLELPGAEFYTGGIYAIKIPPTDDPIFNFDYVASFDWRNRHGANDPESDYYDGDPNGGGWITDFSECQSGCFVNGMIDCSIPPWNCTTSVGVWKPTDLCWAFGPTAHIESLINLYLNYHADINLSEQNIASCEDPQNPTIGGGSTISSYYFYENEGVVDEQTFPFVAEPIPCNIPNPTEHIFIENYIY